MSRIPQPVFATSRPRPAVKPAIAKPVVRVPTRRFVVPRARPSSKVTGFGDFLDVPGAMELILTTLRKCITKVPFIIGVLVVGFILVNSPPDYQSGPIHSIIGSSNNTISRWILRNPNDFTGLMILSTGALALPSSVNLMYLVGCFFWVGLIPEATILEYVVQLVGCLSIFSASGNVRLTLFVGVIIAWLAGWLVFGPTSPGFDASAHNRTGVFSYR